MKYKDPLLSCRPAGVSVVSQQIFVESLQCAGQCVGPASMELFSSGFKVRKLPGAFLLLCVDL